MNLEIYLHQMTILNDGSHYWYKALQVDQGKALGTLFRKGIIIKDKPITASDISELVGLAQAHILNKTPLIEIRCNDTTVFAKPEEFICSIAAKKSFGLEIYLTEGRKYVATDTLDQFSLWMDPFKEIVRCGNSYVNLSHITSCSSFHITLSNGIRLPVNPLERSKFHSVK